MLGRFGGAAAFSDSAEAYAATMAPVLRPVAAEVVRRAALEPGERVLDIGTGTGSAAALARGDGRRVIGVDAAPGMLDIARREVPDVEFVEADFTALPLDDASVDAALAVHALLFGEDKVAALREWRRVTRPGGRLVLSVPGPAEVVPGSIFNPIYLRHGLAPSDDYPTRDDLAGWARDAGWGSVETDADPGVVIRLADEAAFATWLRVGARGRATADWSDGERAAFAADLMAASPRDADGAFRLPFGALFLTARNG